MKKIGVLGAVTMALFLTMACGGSDAAVEDEDGIEEAADDGAEETTDTSTQAISYCSGSCKRLRCWPRPTIRKKTSRGCVFVKCGSTVCG